MDRIEEIEERLHKTTPGPWDNRCRGFSNIEKPRHIWSEYGFIAETWGRSCIADAEFIVAAPVDIRFLLDHTKSLQEELKESARLHGMGASREARLMARVKELEKELEGVRLLHYFEELCKDPRVREKMDHALFKEMQANFENWKKERAGE